MVAADLRSLTEELRGIGVANGLDVVRFAGAEPFEDTLRDLRTRRAAGLHGGMAFTYRKPERSTTPAVSLPDVRALVVAARSYAGAAAAGGAGGCEHDVPADVPPVLTPPARIAKSAASDEYLALRTGLKAIAGRLKREGYRARVVADDNALVDRAAAHRAGIGWWGKNTLIILPGAGSYFVLGSVLTDAPLPADGDTVADRCGPCDRCIPACPTGAIVAPGVLDARRCLSWLLEAPGMIPEDIRPLVGDRLYGCDECQDVCPPNRAATLRRQRTGSGAGAPVGGRTEVDPVAIVLATDEELRARYGHFYLADRDFDLLRRNALVVLGNTATAGDARAHEAIRRGLESPNPVVRAHAVWARGRLEVGQGCVPTEGRAKS